MPRLSDAKRVASVAKPLARTTHGHKMSQDVTRLHLGSHTFCWRLIPYASLTRAELTSYLHSPGASVTWTSKNFFQENLAHGIGETRLT